MIVFATSVLLAAQAAPQEKPDTAVRVPMETAHGMAVVEAKINGKGPYRWIVDTGAAGQGRIDAALAQELELPQAGEAIAGDGSGRNQETRRTVHVDEIELGGVKFEGLELLVGQYAERASGGEPVQGVLGFGLFADWLLTLDYPGGALELRHGELPAQGDAQVMEYTHARAIPAVKLRLGDLEFEADLDTGSMGGLMLPLAWKDQLHLKGEPQVVGKARTTLNEFEILEADCEDALQFAGCRVQPLRVGFAEIFPRANLGQRVLSRFALSFDQRNARLRVVEGKAPPAGADSGRLGVMLRIEGDRAVVDSVDAGSRAARAGLQAGDVLLEADGEPFQQMMERDPSGKAFRAVRKLKLQRGGATLELEIPAAG